MTAAVHMFSKSNYRTIVAVCTAILKAIGAWNVRTARRIWVFRRMHPLWKARYIIRHMMPSVVKLGIGAAAAVIVIVPAIAAFEAHIVNVTGTPAQIDPPILDIPGSGTPWYETEGGVDLTGTHTISITSDDPDATHIFYAYAESDDPDDVPDPECGDPLGGPVGDTHEVEITDDTVIKAIACDGDTNTAHQSLVNVKIYTFVKGPVCPADPDTIEIDDEHDGTEFIYHSNVIIKDGGEFRSHGEHMTFTVACDLTIEDGGEIKTDDTDHAGNLTLFVGGTLTVEEGGEIKAAGSTDSPVETGGNMTIDVGEDMIVDGEIKTDGAQSAGSLDINVEGNLTLGVDGEIKTVGIGSGNNDTGGLLTIDVNGWMMQHGEIKSDGDEHAGDIAIDVDGDYDITSDGEVLARGSLTSGNIEVTVGGDFDMKGDIDTSAAVAGDIDISVEGTTIIGGSSLKARGEDTSSSNRGGVIQVQSDGNLTVTGLIDAYGEEIAGIIELVTDKVFALTASGEIKAESGESSSTNIGGNISVIALEGNSMSAGEVSAYGQERAGNIYYTVHGVLDISGDIKAISGTSASQNTGGTIVLTSSNMMDISSDINATGSDDDGFIQTSYCTNDFVSASFDPSPQEITHCDSVLINEFVPNPTGDDDAPLPAGEYVELYNYGDEDINIDGWFLYYSDDTHELEITSTNARDQFGFATTTIEAGGFLVVYRNGDGDFALNNTGGDEVRLADGDITDTGTLRDFVAYESAAPEGKAYSRVPDGGVWYDPDPSPGKTNVKKFDYYINHFALLIEDVDEKEEADPDEPEIEEGVREEFFDTKPEDQASSTEEIIEDEKVSDAVEDDTQDEHTDDETADEVQKDSTEEVQISEDDEISEDEEIVESETHNQDEENDSGEQTQKENTSENNESTITVPDQETATTPQEKEGETTNGADEEDNEEGSN